MKGGGKRRRDSGSGSGSSSSSVFSSSLSSSLLTYRSISRDLYQFIVMTEPLDDGHGGLLVGDKTLPGMGNVVVVVVAVVVVVVVVVVVGGGGGWSFSL